MSLKGYSKIYQFEMFSPSIFFSRANTILFPQISSQIRFPFSGSAFRPKLWTTSLLLPCFHFCSRRFLNILAFGKCRNRNVVAFSSIWELYGRATMIFVVHVVRSSFSCGFKNMKIAFYWIPPYVKFIS